MSGVDREMLTIDQARQALDAGDVTAVALTQGLLDRIERRDPHIRAYLHVTAEQALEAAQAADRARTQGKSSAELPLLGIPLALKDVLSTKGVETTCGSRILKGYMPPFTATAVENLVTAGAVILGKTNTDEFAMGSSTENSGFYPTGNPWSLDRVPGGSSGGSAAAVAGGLALGALGTDTGGSIRQPAAFCGVVGLKPSYGRVSRYGLIAFGSSLDQMGPLTRNVQDAALLLEVMAGPDPRDSTCLDAPVPTYRDHLDGDLTGLRIGVPEEYFVDGMQEAVATHVRDAIAHLARLGGDIVPVSLPHTEMALPVYYMVVTAEASANLARYDGIRFGHSAGTDSMWSNFNATRAEGFGPEVKRRIMLGTYALSVGYYDAYYLKAQQVRTLIKQDFAEAFAQVDVIASPTTPTTAFVMGERVEDPLAMYLADIFTISANLAGICGISLPCGFDENGLPIGLQLMGPHLGEATILQTAYAYESTTAWHTRTPAMAF